MSVRAPTENQYRLLRALGSGGALVVGRKREVDPLLKRGWVFADKWDGRYWVWVRITPGGLRALADAVEKYGLPEIEPPAQPGVGE